MPTTWHLVSEPLKVSAPPHSTDTPVRRKHGSVNHKCESYDVQTLDKILAEELHGAVYASGNMQDMVEKLFPAHAIPFPVDQGLLRMLEQWNRNSNKWDLIPAAMFPRGNPESAPGHDEERLAQWLSSLGGSIAKVALDSKRISRRKWSARHANKPIQVINHVRKPDVVLVGQDTPLNDIEWKNVRMVWETTSRESLAVVRRTLDSKALCIFTAQPHRRFVPSAYLHRGRLGLCVHTRAGVFTSAVEGIDVNKEPLRLLRVVAGCLFADDLWLGYDPSVERKKDNITHITVNQRRYTIVAEICRTDVIRGRATTCWHALDQAGDNVVIKAGWPSADRQWTEADMLRRAADAGVNNIPHVIVEESLGDFSSSARANIEVLPWYCDALEKRLFKRLVITPLAQPITNFRSKKELLNALIDIIFAIKHLAAGNIVHRDISLNNIMLSLYTPVGISCETIEESSRPLQADVESGTAAHSGHTALRRGILVDFDYAAPMDELAKKPSVVDRTGTIPFMSLELLQQVSLDVPADEVMRHQPVHDLESIFYVLIWICSTYSAPGKLRKEYPPNFPLLQWSSPTVELSTLTYIKLGQVTAGPRVFTSAFTPYFAELEQCIHRLFDVLFPHRIAYVSKNTVSPESFARVLLDGLNALPNESAGDSMQPNQANSAALTGNFHVQSENLHGSGEMLPDGVQSMPYVRRSSRLEAVRRKRLHREM